MTTYRFFSIKMFKLKMLSNFQQEAQLKLGVADRTAP